MKYSDITILLDRSGSMNSIRDDVVGGLNEFIRTQKATPDVDIRITFVQFDTNDKTCVDTVFAEKRVTEIRDLGPEDFLPRGGTPLLDALGMVINETGKRIEKKPESDRPDLVVFVVMTDGQENSSREFKKSDIKKMIEHQTSKYNWQFIFLGANQDSFAEAGGLGINRGTVSNYAPSGQCINAAYVAAGQNVNKVARQAVKCMADLNFTAEQKDQMN